MDAYRCAYRDSKSPLTPIPPMDTGAFEFNEHAIAKYKQLTPNMAATFNKKPTNTVRNVTPNTRMACTYERNPTNIARNVTPNTRLATCEQRSASTPNAVKIFKEIKECVVYKNINGEIYKYKKNEQYKYEGNGLPAVRPRQCQRQFKKASPVPPKPLCPKMKWILEEVGLQEYKKLFRDEEIDYNLFKQFTEEDLYAIGIREKSVLDILLDYLDYC